MLYTLLVIFFIANALLLGLLVLIQQSKGSSGLGVLGGGTQMLFGGSGGQDIFQKITWVLGTLFMALSLILAIMKSKQLQTFGDHSLPAQIEHSLPIEANEEAE